MNSSFWRSDSVGVLCSFKPTSRGARVRVIDENRSRYDRDRGRGYRAGRSLRVIGFRRRVLQDQNIAKINVHAFMNESADGSIIARRIPSEVEIGSEHDHGSCGRGCAPPKRRGAIQADKRKGRGATLLNPMKQSAKCIFVSALITIWWWQVTTL